jgi:hypothetical protein
MLALNYVCLTVTRNQRRAGTQTQMIKGAPDRSPINTSFIARQNLTMRMSMRRFTRLRNAFSKTFENRWHALALISYFYNFGRVHKTLGVSPAMASGLVEDDGHCGFD